MEKPDLDGLKELIESASRKAQSIGTEVLASHAQAIEPVDPITLFVAAESMTSDRWYWRCPDTGRTIVSLGILTGTTPPRNVRFQEAGRHLGQVKTTASFQNDSGDDDVAPIFHVGFSFDPRHLQDRLVWQGYPSTYVLTPRMTFIQDSDQTILIQNNLATGGVLSETLIAQSEEFNSALVDAVDTFSEHHLIVDELEPDETNETELRNFVRAIGRAEAAVKRQDLEVITIARRRKLITGGIYRMRKAISYLAERYPEDLLLAVGRHGSTFVGRCHGYLLQQNGRQVRAETRTGAIRRGEDSDLDNALVAQLWNNANEVEHHELCVDHLYEALESVLGDVEASDEPQIRSTKDQHRLCSTVEGTMPDSATSLEILRELHPIVETSGAPADEAFDFIQSNEEVDRGWFGSPLGWISLNEESQIAVTASGVVVRAPVMHQQRAYVFTSLPVFSGIDPDDAIERTDQDINVYRFALSE
jgi:menaquinone-specific isochorismate synthase